jgi:hypothetical protein
MENKMQLNNPITLTRSPLTKNDGSIVNFSPITISSLEYLLYDDITRKLALVYIRPCSKPLILWQNSAYDAAGDYTQAQIESRIIELLGDNIQNSLQQIL